MGLLVFGRLRITFAQFKHGGRRVDHAIFVQFSFRPQKLDQFSGKFTFERGFTWELLSSVNKGTVKVTKTMVLNSAVCFIHISNFIHAHKTNLSVNLTRLLNTTLLILNLTKFYRKSIKK